MKWELMLLSFFNLEFRQESSTHPDLNQKLTKEIAKFHVESLDEIGSLYYSEEKFDDFLLWKRLYFSRHKWVYWNFV